MQFPWICRMTSESVRLLTRLTRATLFSLAGLRGAFRNEPAFRLELALSVFVIPAAWILRSSGVERALLIGSWMMVILVEIINSAIEAVVDRIGKERHELSGRAKDLGSAAVFCSIVMTATIWLIVLSHP